MGHYFPTHAHVYLIVLISLINLRPIGNMILHIALSFQTLLHLSPLLIFLRPLLLKLQIESNRALRLELQLSSPEIDLFSCLPLERPNPAAIAWSNNGRDDGGGIGGGNGDEALPPLSVACAGGDINAASCGEVILLALSDLTMTEPADPELALTVTVCGGPLLSWSEFCARSLACRCSCFWKRVNGVLLRFRHHTI